MGEIKHGGSWAYRHHKCRCELCLGYHERYKEANRDRILANARRQRETHVEQLKQYHQERYAVDPIGYMARQASRKSTADEHTEAYWRILRSDPCSYCGEDGQGVDHITAVSAGGDWGFANLTASCRRCNARKYRDRLVIFLARGGLSGDLYTPRRLPRSFDTA